MKKNGTNPEVTRRTRKMLLLLPVVLIPMLAIGFYALGGGRAEVIAKRGGLTKGLNTSLPEARFDMKKKMLNKLGIYRQAEQDSIRIREMRKMDPYYRPMDSMEPAITSRLDHPLGKLEVPGSRQSMAIDSQADGLLKKLDHLKGILSRQQQNPLAADPPVSLPRNRIGYPAASPQPFFPTSHSAGISRPVEAEADPDFDKLNALMDKVLKVQHPAEPSVGDTSPPSHPPQVIQALSTPIQEETVTTLDAGDRDELQTGFIDLDEGPATDTPAAGLIAAVVDGAQTLISGEELCLRTATDARFGAIRVPCGTQLSAKAVLSGERLLVTINGIRVEDRVIPVSLDVIDLDGVAGIQVKGSINRDVSKESAGEAIGSLGLASMDPSVAGQATVAGMQAAKNLLGRKFRLVRVGLPDGYRLLLRNNKLNH